MAALILCAERALSAAAVVAALQAHGLDAASTRVLTQVAALPSASIGAEGSDTASVIVSHAASPAHHSAEFLRELHRVLRADGKLVLDEAGVAQARLPSAGGTQPRASLGLDATRCSALCAALLLAGFVDAQASGSCVAARKPAWKVGAAFSLRDRQLQKAAASAPAAAAWKITAEDGDDELMNEDELLTEEDLVRPAKAPGADDCEVGAAGRKACVNCTCGRAEGKVTIDAGSDANAALPASACGNCYLGDAYRCAGCPYLGKPAFKPGDKVLLSVGGADL